MSLLFVIIVFKFRPLAFQFKIFSIVAFRLGPFWLLSLVVFVFVILLLLCSWFCIFELVVLGLKFDVFLDDPFYS